MRRSYEPVRLRVIDASNCNPSPLRPIPASAAETYLRAKDEAKVSLRLVSPYVELWYGG